MDKYGLSILGEVNVLPAELKALEALTYSKLKAFLYMRGGAAQYGLVFRGEVNFKRSIIFEKLVIRFASEKPLESFSISGTMLLHLEKFCSLRFIIECSAAANRFYIQGFLEDIQQGLVLFGHFTVTELGVIFGLSGTGLFLGLLGGFRLKTADIWGFALCKLGDMAEPAVFMAVLPQMSLRRLTELFTGAPPQAFSFEFLSINNLGITAHLSLGVPEIARIVDSINRNIPDLENRLTAEDTHIWPSAEGILVTDIKNSRCYKLTKPEADGCCELCIPPQLYVNNTGSPFRFGRYCIEPGMSLCASVSLLGVNMAVYFRLGADGLTVYQRLEPINLKLLKLSAPKTVIENNELNAASQFLPSGASGPLLYLRMCPEKQEVFLDARLEILKVLDFSAKVLICGKQVKIDCIQSLGGLNNVRFKVDSGHDAFAGSAFSILLTISLGDLEETAELCAMDAQNRNGGASPDLGGLLREYAALEDKLSALRNPWDNGLYGAGACAEGLELAKTGLHTTAALVNESNFKALTYLKKIEIKIDLDGYSAQKRLEASLTVEFVFCGRPKIIKAKFDFNVQKLAGLIKSQILGFFKSQASESNLYEEHSPVSVMDFGGLKSAGSNKEDFKRFAAAQEKLLASSEADEKTWLIEDFFILDASEQQMNALLRMLEAGESDEAMRRELYEQKARISQIKEKICIKAQDY